MNQLIEVTHLTKIYGKKGNQSKILDNLSFTVEKGDFLGVMGPSGAGKSTLLHLLSTIDRPSMGSIKISGKDTTKMRESTLCDFRRQELGFVFQDFNLMDSLSVRDNILLPLALDRYSVKDMEKRLNHLVQMLGIEGILERFPSDISIGQKQRVAVARAMVTKPQLIFADEPTGSLDSKSATELLQYLNELNSKEKTTIVMVTHDAFTASYCNRIVFIKDGIIFSEIIRQASRKEFFKKIIDVQTVIGGGTNHDII